VRDNLRKMAPRLPLPVVQVHGEGVSPKGHEFEPPSVRTLYTCGSVAGRSRVRGSVRYITHDSCAISVVPPFNKFTDKTVKNNLHNHFKVRSLLLRSDVLAASIKQSRTSIKD